MIARLSAVLCMALIAAHIASAHARPVEIYAPSLGIGHLSCFEWTKGRTNGGSLRQLYASWALGYVSGYNQFGPPKKQLFLQYDADNIVRFLDGACERNPNTEVSHTAAHFIFGLTRTESARELIRPCAMDVDAPSRVRVSRTEYVDRPELLAPWFSRLTRDDAYHRRRTMFVVHLHDGVSEQVKSQVKVELRKSRIGYVLSSGVPNAVRRPESEFCSIPN